LQYFAIKRALAPIALGSKRYVERKSTDPYSAIKFLETTTFEFWASSSLLEDREPKLVVEGFELSSGKRTFVESEEVTVHSNRATELRKITAPRNDVADESDLVVFAKLVDEKSGNVLSRTAAWPEP
jgi:beta-mannosidase